MRDSNNWGSSKDILTIFRFSSQGRVSDKRKIEAFRTLTVLVKKSEVAGPGRVFGDPPHHQQAGGTDEHRVKPKATRSKVLMIAATALAITMAGSADAKHDRGGEGRHARDSRATWGWHDGAAWHDNGRHLGWYKHGWGGSGWRGPASVGSDVGWWDGHHIWGWSGFGWGWDPGLRAWSSLLVGASIGVIVAPPLIVAAPPIYAAPPPIVARLPYIDPPPIAVDPPPVAGAPTALISPSPIGPLLGAAVPPPIVVLPAPEIVVAAAPPLMIFAPPAFAFFIGPPVLAFATIGPGWWNGGYITGGFTAVGAGAAVARFGHPGAGFVGPPHGPHGPPVARSHWTNAWHGGGFAGWYGGGGGHGGGGWHYARGGGGFAGGHGHGH